ncbi:hypothetical protein IWQ62_003031 [Dispira parvispora]|uniref:valine--tRNA ligase n=1 Tax=Dispira parvispora TaxID=1520584 RepID=A0A9W8AP78_9FUNG|nr:hypothetical protein IWQ62_003031 [Dispira parvispora]
MRIDQAIMLLSRVYYAFEPYMKQLAICFSFIGVYQIVFQFLVAFDLLEYIPKLVASVPFTVKQKDMRYFYATMWVWDTALRNRALPINLFGPHVKPSIDTYATRLAPYMDKMGFGCANMYIQQYLLQAFGLRARRTERFLFRGSASSFATGNHKTLATQALERAIPRPHKPFLKTYDAGKVETEWYSWWQAQRLFNPQTTSSSSPPFTMLAPPPNITGSLHIGHALTVSIQDAIARWKRMTGVPVNWIPGTDHAGIATQTVVEKQLAREQHLGRHDLSREEFMARVWQWQQSYSKRIRHQHQQLGASMNWEAEFFTLDEACSRTVRQAFVDLFRQGYVYRDTRIVHWCCKLQTVLSDIEVDTETIEEPTFVSLPGKQRKVEFGRIYRVAYPLAAEFCDVNSTVQELVVATTRPETLPADVALAVHPEDERYRHLHGGEVIHPLTGDRLPIITDAELVDPTFGTGVVKITPGHDANDYACGKRHGLAVKQCFNVDGTLRADCGVPEVTGLDRYEARRRILALLDERGYSRGQDVHPMSISRCSRTGDIIEPLVQPQWFINCQKMAQQALQVVEQGQLTFLPTTGNARQEWQRWLGDIQDWCVSRQLWWGHRIPAYQIEFTDPLYRDHAGWVAVVSEENLDDAVREYKVQRGIPLHTNCRVTQDPDVLDTWFSSGLLPLSVMGLQRDCRRDFSSLLETGQDILFFWVARMVMLTLFFTGQTPFDQVVLHPMVRDAQGRKMSKSLGNVIDPLQVIHGASLATLQETLQKGFLEGKELQRSCKKLAKQYPRGIAPHGADALRFTLVAYTQQTHQINMDIANVTANTHFCNKIWNLVRYTIDKLDTLALPKGFRPRIVYQTKAQALSESIAESVSGDMATLDLLHRYILSRLASTVAVYQDAMDEYQLYMAADAVKKFIINDLCATYLEFIKLYLSPSPMLTTEVQQAHYQDTLQILVSCIDGSLRMLHPFMPFVTEELWQHLVVDRCQMDLPSLNSSANSNDVPQGPPTLMLASAPRPVDWSRFQNEDVEHNVQMILQILHKMRVLRQTQNIPVSHALPFTVWVTREPLYDHIKPLLAQYIPQITKLAKASTITVQYAGNTPQGTATRLTDEAYSETPQPGIKVLLAWDAVTQAHAGWVSTPRGTTATSSNSPSSPTLENATGVYDQTACQRLEKRKVKLQQDLDKLLSNIDNPSYQQRVPPAVQKKDQQRVERFRHAISVIDDELHVLTQKQRTTASP